MRSKLFAHLRNQWMGALALFLVLTGGAAYATHEVIRSSDIVDGEVKIADIGPGAVATSEVLNDTATGGGLAAADLRSGSVGTAEVANNGLTGADINEAALTGSAKKIDYTAPANGNMTTIGTFGPYTLKAKCSPGISTRVYVNGPAGTAVSMYSKVLIDSEDEGNLSEGSLIPANTDTQILVVGAGAGLFRRIGGRSILRSGSALVQIDFLALADGQTGSCFVYGTATTAT